MDCTVRISSLIIFSSNFHVSIKFPSLGFKPGLPRCRVLLKVWYYIMHSQLKHSSLFPSTKYTHHLGQHDVVSSGSGHLSEILRQAWFRRSDWLFKLFQPIRMLQIVGTVNFSQKFFAGSGPGPHTISADIFPRLIRCTGQRCWNDFVEGSYLKNKY